MCRIGYGNGGLGGTACNVVHDAVGQHRRAADAHGQRRLSYFASGRVRTIAERHVEARFRYDAFGEVQELDVEGGGGIDARRDRRYGGLIERRDRRSAASTTSFITRQFPGPAASSPAGAAPASKWIFEFGEARGNRFFTDADGAFVQDVDYQPFGEATSSGAQPGSAQLHERAVERRRRARGVRPVAPRRAPLRPGHRPVPEPRSAARPAHGSDHQPLRVRAERSAQSVRSHRPGLHRGECRGRPWDGPSRRRAERDQPAGLYFPPAATPAGANPQAAYRPPIPTTFSGPPKGPQTAAGRALKEKVYDLGFEMGENFNFDTLAATGMSIDAVLERIDKTPSAHRAIDRYNAKINSVGSFFAGFGDAINWACLYPGCGRDLRAALSIDTGDADGWSYFWGAVTGIAGSLAAPRPTAIPVVSTSAPTSGATFGGDIINASRATENCASCAFTLDHMLGGGYPASAVLAHSPAS